MSYSTSDLSRKSGDIIAEAMRPVLRSYGDMIPITALFLVQVRPNIRIPCNSMSATARAKNGGDVQALPGTASRQTGCPPGLMRKSDLAAPTLKRE
jgi:hypothetical protein